MAITNLDSLTLSGDLVVAGGLTLSGDQTLDDLTVTDDAAIGGDLAVTGNETVGGTLAVTGASTLTGNVAAAGTLAVTGASTLTGNVTAAGTLAVTGASTLTGNVTASGTLGVTGATTLSSTLAVTGACTFSTPLTVAQVNSAIESKIIAVPIVGTIADGTTYTLLVAPGRAGTVTKISIAAVTKPAGGTNTVEVLKNGTTTMLVAATFDPTTITTDLVSQALSLTATGADLALVATDVIKIVWTAGTQTTDAVAPVITIEMNLTTDY